MGGYHSDDAGETFRKQDWDLLDGNLNDRLWVNRHDPNLKVEQFQLFPENQNQFNRQKDMYYLRKNSAHLVAALFLQNQEQGDFCSSTYRQKLFLQTIPIRLSDIQHIPFPDYLHLFNQSLRGFQQLSREVGYFSVEEEYIGINNNGVVKVWMNQHFDKSFAVGGSTITEEIMVRGLIDLIDRNMDQNQLQNNIPSVRNYLYRNADSLKFQSAIRELDQFIREYNRGEIPPKLDCIDRVGGISAIANRNRDSSKYVQTTIQKPIFIPNNYQQQQQQPIQQFQRPQLIDGQLNGQFASSFTKFQEPSVRPPPTNQVNFVPMRGSEIIRQGQIVDPSIIRQNIPIIRSGRAPVVQVVRDSKTSSQKGSQIFNQPLPPQLVVNPYGQQQRIVQTAPIIQSQNRQFVVRNQVLPPSVIVSQQPPIQTRQLHFEQHPQSFPQQVPPPGFIYTQPQQVIQTQVNQPSLDSSALRREVPVPTYIYSSVKSPEQLKNVPINQTSQKNGSISVNQFNGAVQRSNANNTASNSIGVISNEKNTTFTQQEPISNVYAFNIHNNNDFASNSVNAINQEKNPTIVQSEEPTFNFSDINSYLNTGSYKAKQVVSEAQSNENKVQSPSIENKSPNLQFQPQQIYNFRENNTSSSPSYQIPTYQYGGNQSEDISVSFNPSTYGPSDNHFQSFKKKQAAPTSTYQANFNIDDGKSSDDFLKKLRQIGSPTATKLGSQFSPSFKKPSENNQNNVSPVRQQNSYESVPIARQLNSYETVPTTQGSDYTYNQSFQYNQQEQPVYSQNFSNNIENSPQNDDEFGRNAVSNIIVPQQSSPHQITKNKQVVAQPMKFEQNLDMKYSVVGAQQLQPTQFKFSSAAYSPSFDPQLLADMNILSQYS